MLQLLAIARSAASSQPGGLPLLFLRIISRVLQFVLGLTAIGIYASDNFHNGAHQYTQSLFAVTIGGLSTITTVIYLIPAVKSYLAFLWDALLFILWIAVFGTFAKLYLGKSGEMHNSIWVDLANVFLWACTAVAGGLMFFRERGRKRAMMHSEV